MPFKGKKIRATVVSKNASSSTSALAKHLQNSCGHVLLDERILNLDYKFHSEISDEIPAFFIKRLSTGSNHVSLMIQGGLTLVDELDPFLDCKSIEEVESIIRSSDYHESFWKVIVTVGVQIKNLEEVGSAKFVAKYPNEFRVISEELISLGLLNPNTCKLCEPDEDTGFTLRPTGT